MIKIITATKLPYKYQSDIKIVGVVIALAPTKLPYKYQSDIKTLIKLAYTSSFKPNIITKSLIDEIKDIK